MGCLFELLVLSIFIWGHVFIVDIALGNPCYTGDFLSDFLGTVVMILAVIIDLIIIGYVVIWIFYWIWELVDKYKNWKIAKLNKVKEKYSPNNVLLIKDGKKFNIDEDMINSDIVNTFEELKKHFKEPIAKCNAIDNQMEDILSCNFCKKEYKKYKYVTTEDNINKLDKLKLSRDAYNNIFRTAKIKLINQEAEPIYKFEEFCYSLKCDIRRFHGLKSEVFNSDIPLELNCFEYDYKPVIVNNENYYCFFSNVILIFDSNGRFSTAVDPSALKVKCVKIDKSEYDEELKKMIYDYDYVFTVSIGNNKIVFTTEYSGYDKTINKSIAEYARKYNDRHDIVPSLFELLTKISENSKITLNSIEDIYKQREKVTNYFCMLKEMTKDIDNINL